MATQRGRDLLIKIHDGNGFITVGGLRAKALKFNAKTVDVTHSESEQAWRELLPESGVKSIEISGQGIFRDGASDALVRQNFFDQSAENYQVIIPDFGVLEGPFLISALNYSGNYNGEASYEIVLNSAGKPVFTAT